MGVKLTDLRKKHGDEGARSNFEKLVALIIKGEYPNDASRIQVVQGDGGVDVYIGEYGGDIEVFQIKFHPEPLGKSQKDKITASFKTCRTNRKFTLKRWTLCLPRDLGEDETTWFTAWKRRQAKHGVEIATPWCALRLERLLYDPKNHPLRDDYFDDEHKAKISDIHKHIVPQVEEQERQRRAEKLQHDTTAVNDFRTSLSEWYNTYSQACVNAMGHPHRRPWWWEVTIRPLPLHDEPIISRLGECRAIIDSCQVNEMGWEFPTLRGNVARAEKDWTQLSYWRDLEVESWRLTQRGIFGNIFPIWDDVPGIPDLSGYSPIYAPLGYEIRRLFRVDSAMMSFHLIFRFARELATRAYPHDVGVEITICLRGTANRVLAIPRNHHLPGFCESVADTVSNNWSFQRDELTTDLLGCRNRAAIWVFERFLWHNVSDVVLNDITDRFLRPPDDVPAKLSMSF